MIKNIKYAKYYMDVELDGKIVKIDDGFTSITGYTWEDVVENNMTILSLIPEQSRAEYMAVLYKAQSDGEAYLNHEILCKNGTIIAVNCFGEVYKDENTGHKYPLADYELMPTVAICDAELTLDIPQKLTAYAGFDVKN